MTTYNTGNPIGSTDARDRLDNTENMDILENSTTLDAHPDRLGVLRKTRKGMELEHDNQISAHEAEHDAQIAAHEAEHDNQMQSFENEFDGRLAGMAFTRVGSFTTGATLTDMRQVLVWEASKGGDGHEYGWTGSFPKVVAAGATPATSGGIGAGAWIDRSDMTLRNDLAETGGAGLITDTLKPVTWSGFAGGADKTGVADSDAAFNSVSSSAAAGQSIITPAGTYKRGATEYQVESDSIWLNRNSGLSVNTASSARKSPIVITVGTSTEPTIDAIYTRSGIDIAAVGRGAQHIDCIRGTLYNSSTDGNGNTCFYAAAISDNVAMWSAALHGETKHGGGTTIGISSESASYSSSGSFYGAVLNNTSGNAQLTHPITGQQIVAHPSATALYITGSDERGDAGQWLRGIRFSPKSMRGIGTLIRDESSCAQGYWSQPTSAKTNADILLEGVAPQGIILQGTYSSGNAIRLKSGDAVAYDVTGAIKTKYSPADLQWGMYNGATQRVGFGTASYGMYFNGLKVVGERQGSIPNATVGTEVSVINSILTALRNHGLVATA